MGFRFIVLAFKGSPVYWKRPSVFGCLVVEKKWTNLSVRPYTPVGFCFPTGE